eukprot:XP_011543937.1 cytokine receptor-like factor 2 isoform X2 [Homo sapiens]
MGRLVLLWGAAVFLLGGWMALGQGGAAEGVQIQIIYFNLETVQVTWNASKYSRTNLTFHYRFNGDEAYDQCTNYLLQEGHTSGCLLDAEQRDDILYFSIRNGTHPVFTASRWMVYYLKPSSPKHVRFSWHQDAVTVTCSDLSYGDLLYEVQYRSPFDTEWQGEGYGGCIWARHIPKRLVRGDMLAERRDSGCLCRDTNASQTKAVQIYFNFQPGHPSDGVSPPSVFMEIMESEEVSHSQRARPEIHLPRAL